MKMIMMFLFILLDVIMFPFSCVEDKNKNQYIFAIEIIDDEAEYSYYKEIVGAIPKNHCISFPLELEGFTIDQYRITGWVIYEYTVELEQCKEVQFPYILEEEDYLKYYRGHKQSVVFMAKWEYIEYA